jgi:hypothetical protein
MKKELDEQLCAKYPKIFVNRHADMTTTAMCWGFECGDGWYNILDQLCGNIQHHIDWSHKNYQWDVEWNIKNPDSPREVREPVFQVVATQVKEKFGGLRFYYDGGDDYIRGLSSMAEAMSEVTCEECGAPGKRRGGGWIYTACDTHARDGDKE